ncbi:FadR family transcriptional regulator [Arsenicitalea aurantiaca]|uniref:FadR family transcriptional regulator n=1 Tax=Arsenicitalea aurantiaca TaxID=1783274 RepID=A0A433XK08_9HYPH|nr:FCD domain-containing protein [Arsenicitalea aurantiaca]RUT34410.1 FadR family transcriptional regulator [Arsenicitalea aurantiaca]
MTRLPHPQPNLFTPVTRRRRRPEIIAERIKALIRDAGLVPGDRLPQEKELMERFSAAKGTVREAMKSLETQGLIVTRTGPGGGAFVSRLSGDHAMELLANYFFFSPPGLSEIYTLRRLLEPEIARSVAGQLAPSDLRRLEATMRLYDHPPADAEELVRQRVAELDFHSVLAELSPNPVLGFVAGLMQNLLRDLPVCRRIYAETAPGPREVGLLFQMRLMSAISENRPDDAYRIAAEHMAEAERYMLARAAELDPNGDVR